jgi:DNA-binding transcriptional LysR family regulator
MIDYLDKISAHKCLILNTIIRQGSPSAAARSLNLPVSKIHNDIKSIEKAVGGPILLRSQRKVVLTPLGEKFAEFARVVVEGIHYLEEEKSQGSVSDVIIGCPTAFAQSYMPDALIAFHEKHPNVKVHLYTGIEYMDFTLKDVDVVIGLHLDNRIDLTQNYLYTADYYLYASKSYLEKHSVPKTLADLKKHKLLNFIGLEEDGKNYASLLKDQKISISSNNSNALVELCENGMGIGCFAADIMKIQGRHGKSLIPILADQFQESFKCYYLSRKFNQKSMVIQSLKDICFDVVQKKIENFS